MGLHVRHHVATDDRIEVAQATAVRQCPVCRRCPLGRDHRQSSSGTVQCTKQLTGTVEERRRVPAQLMRAVGCDSPFHARGIKNFIRPGPRHPDHLIQWRPDHPAQCHPVARHVTGISQHRVDHVAD